MVGLGIMSGSSLDGLDLALVKFGIDQDMTWEFRDGHTYSFDKGLSQKLRSVIHANPFQLAETEFEYSEFVAECILNFMSKEEIKLDFIALHGQTVLHLVIARYHLSITVSHVRHSEDFAYRPSA